MPSKPKPNARLYKHRINKHGYDRHDHYWGIGLPLWRCETDDDTFYVRANTRRDAKEKFVRLYSFLVFNNR